MTKIQRIDFNGLAIKLLKSDGTTLSIAAVSGKPLYQNPAFQHVSDTGPLPEGKYHINIADIDWRDSVVEDRVWGNAWGDARVTLIPDPSTNLMGRSGFFLHGSLEGNGYGSAGCIDLGRSDSVIFKLLESEGESQIEVNVKYNEYLKEHFHPVYMDDPKIPDYFSYVAKHSDETGILPDNLLDVPSKANSWGDPHLITWDGLSYDFQMPGEHVLVASKTDDFQVQIRTQLMPNSKSISYNTAVATRLGNTKLDISLPPRIAGRLQGTPGDDLLIAAADTKLILGGQDTGTAEMTTKGGFAMYRNFYPDYAHSYGYYVKDDAGNPTTGQIILANTQAAGLGENVLARLDIPQEKLGYFVITSGASFNNIVNGEAVTFQSRNGGWIPFKASGAEIVNSGTYRNPPNPAFFSDVALNTYDRGRHMVVDTTNGDNLQKWYARGAAGTTYGWHDFTIRASLNQTMSISRGDTLVGSSAAENFGYVMGQDGVDRIKNFDPTKDTITVYGNGNSSIDFVALPKETFIRMTPADGGTPGGILVEDVTVASLTPRVIRDASTVIQTSPLTIAGKEVQMQSGELRAVEDGLIYRNDDQYTVLTGGGDGFVATLYADRIDVQPFLSANRSKNSISGLMGTNDGNPANDLTRRDGTVLGTQVTAEELYGAFADDWRVSPEQSLFSYRNGQNTSTFNDPSFTKKYITIKDFDADAIVAARAKVAKAGYNESSPLFNNMLLEQLAGGIDISQPIGVSERDYARIRDVEIVTPTANNTSPTGSSSSSSSSSTAPFDSGDTGYTGGYTGGYIPSFSSSSSSTGNGNNTLPEQANDTSRGLGTGAIIGIVAGAAAVVALVAYLTRRWRRRPAAPAQAEVPPSANNNGRSEAGVEMAEQAAAPVVNPAVAESGKQGNAVTSESSECPSVVVSIRDEAKSSEGAHVAALNRSQSPVPAVDRSANVAPHTSQVARLAAQPLVGSASRGV